MALSRLAVSNKLNTTNPSQRHGRSQSAAAMLAAHPYLAAAPSSLGRRTPPNCTSRTHVVARAAKRQASTRQPGNAAAANSTRAPAGNPWSQPGYEGAIVSQLPEAQQAAAVAAIAVALGVGTWLNSTLLGPAVSQLLPTFLQGAPAAANACALDCARPTCAHRGCPHGAVTRTSWFPLGPIFIAAGIAHFTEEQGFKNMMPHQVCVRVCMTAAAADATHGCSNT